MQDPLSIAFAAKIAFPPVEATELPPSWAADGLVLPVFLIFLSAVLGGLRALLASPWRDSMLAGLPEDRRKRIEARLDHAAGLVSTTGLLRTICVFAAVFLLVQHAAPLDTLLRWLIWGGACAFGAVALEGISSLVARGRGIGLSLAALPLVRLLAIPLRPLTLVVDWFLNRLGTNPASERVSDFASDILEASNGKAREGGLGDDERRMIGRILYLPETDAAEVMTPRTELTAVPAEASVAEALRVGRDDGHSRILVYEEDLDHVVGVFYVKDVLLARAEENDLDREKVREHMREPMLVPETLGVLPLLEDMRRRRNHLAVVVDEYGGTAGVVTIEDLLEEIVGEIEDEHDPEDEAVFMERLGPDELLVEGRIPISDLNETFGTALPENEDYDTLGGLLFDRFGHIPERGEILRVDGVVLEVVEVGDRRIQRVRVRRTETAESDAA